MSARDTGPGSLPERPRVGVISLGCAKNLVDTEVMLGHMDRAGWTVVQDPAEAEVLLVNTCGFVDAAREESIRTILEAAQYKKSGKLRKLVVAGCLVQRYADELRRNLPEVDAFIGLDELDRIVPRTVHGVEPRETSPPSAGASGLVVLPSSREPSGRDAHGCAAPTTEPLLPGPAKYLYDHNTPRRLATPRFTAYLKIAEGCDHTCSFCAIPSFRGVFRSRRPESVIEEARALVRSGVREISLIAQDSSHYGRDQGHDEGLASLLEGLDAIEGVRWIRLHYLYPNTITDHLIRTMARLPRVVKYVDLPLQHAHPAVLKRMRRGGSTESHLELLGRIRGAMPDAAVRTTFIVGFPGETEEEFSALLRFVDEARFDHVGAFTYSHEEGTTAFALADDVPRSVKNRRRASLMARQQEIVLDRNASIIGRTVEVLVEGAHPETEHLLVGRMRSQALDVDGQVLLSDGIAEPGQFVRVELLETAGYDLVGRILGAA